MPYTLVSFHAHPDDEALLTAGTLARAAAEGHRVVIVAATRGEVGLASSRIKAEGDLGARREDELRRSAKELGCARVEFLGYPDSGMGGTNPGGFASADVDEAAGKLAAILTEEDADVLTTYDPRGGYGHPDHVRVHHVGARAADLAGTPVVLEATVDRRQLQRALRVIRRFRTLSDDFKPARFADQFTPPEELTHRIDVRGFVAQKRAAMAAHVSQGSSDTGDRTLSVLMRLPRPIFRWALGHEWYVERGRTPEAPLLDDIFATVRSAAG